MGGSFLWQGREKAFDFAKTLAQACDWCYHVRNTLSRQGEGFPPGYWILAGNWETAACGLRR